MQIVKVLKSLVYLPVAVIVFVLFWSGVLYLQIIASLLSVYVILGLINNFTDKVNLWMDITEIFTVVVFAIFTFEQKLTLVGSGLCLYMVYLLYRLARNYPIENKQEV